MTDVFGERRGEESGLCMWGKDNRLQLRVRQHFKLDLCRIGRACLLWCGQSSLLWNYPKVRLMMAIRIAEESFYR